jgi:hypothetical protein
MWRDSAHRGGEKFRFTPRFVLQALDPVPGASVEEHSDCPMIEAQWGWRYESRSACASGLGCCYRYRWRFRTSHTSDQRRRRRPDCVSVLDRGPNRDTGRDVSGSGRCMPWVSEPHQRAHHHRRNGQHNQARRAPVAGSMAGRAMTALSAPRFETHYGPRAGATAPSTFCTGYKKQGKLPTATRSYATLTYVRIV